MAVTYSVKTLGKLIEELKSLPEGAVIRGIQSGALHSDRGYYERAAVTPEEDRAFPADLLAQQFEDSIGSLIYGWKGGEYTVSAALPVAYADYGNTGPYLGGFARVGDSVYEPVLIEEGWWF